MFVTGTLRATSIAPEVLNTPYLDEDYLEIALKCVKSPLIENRLQRFFTRRINLPLLEAGIVRMLRRMPTTMMFTCPQTATKTKRKIAREIPLSRKKTRNKYLGGLMKGKRLPDSILKSTVWLPCNKAEIMAS